jgi:tRNA(Ile)-lysidine synthase TilS/MesJ
MTTDAELRAAGWQRCFIADEPRLSEAVDTYQELGFEVIVLPVRADDDTCNECMRQAPDRFRVIYIRRNSTQGPSLLGPT